MFGAGVSPGVSWYSVLVIFWPRRGVCPLIACRMRWGSVLARLLSWWGLWWRGVPLRVGGVPWSRAGPRASPWSEVMIVWVSSFLAIWRAAWAACRACCG